MLVWRHNRSASRFIDRRRIRIVAPFNLARTLHVSLAVSSSRSPSRPRDRSSRFHVPISFPSAPVVSRSHRVVEYISAGSSKFTRASRTNQSGHQLRSPRLLCSAPIMSSCQCRRRSMRPVRPSSTFLHSPSLRSRLGAGLANMPRGARRNSGSHRPPTVTRTCGKPAGAYRFGGDQSRPFEVRLLNFQASPSATPTPMATVRSTSTVRTIVDNSKTRSLLRACAYSLHLCGSIMFHAVVRIFCWRMGETGR